MPIVNGQEFPYKTGLANTAPSPALPGTGQVIGGAPPVAQFQGGGAAQPPSGGAQPGAGAGIPNPGQPGAQVGGFVDPREQLVGDFIRERMNSLGPQERNILGAAATPEFAAVMYKLFGAGIGDLLDQAVVFNQSSGGRPTASNGATGLRGVGG